MLMAAATLLLLSPDVRADDALKFQHPERLSCAPKLAGREMFDQFGAAEIWYGSHVVFIKEFGSFDYPSARSYCRRFEAAKAIALEQSRSLVITTEGQVEPRIDSRVNGTEERRVRIRALRKPLCGLHRRSGRTT
jgi:hypothetical protein